MRGATRARELEQAIIAAGWTRSSPTRYSSDKMQSGSKNCSGGPQSAFCHGVGRVAEWFKAAVLKSAAPFTSSGVQCRTVAFSASSLDRLIHQMLPCYRPCPAVWVRNWVPSRRGRGASLDQPPRRIQCLTTLAGIGAPISGGCFPTAPRPRSGARFSEIAIRKPEIRIS